MSNEHLTDFQARVKNDLFQLVNDGKPSQDPQEIYKTVFYKMYDLLVSYTEGPMNRLYALYNFMQNEAAVGKRLEAAHTERHEGGITDTMGDAFFSYEALFNAVDEITNHLDTKPAKPTENKAPVREETGVVMENRGQNKGICNMIDRTRAKIELLSDVMGNEHIDDDGYVPELSALSTFGLGAILGEASEDLEHVKRRINACDITFHLERFKENTSGAPREAISD